MCLELVAKLVDSVRKLVSVETVAAAATTVFVDVCRRVARGGASGRCASLATFAAEIAALGDVRLGMFRAVQ